jgi:hypothetical protein
VLKSGGPAAVHVAGAAGRGHDLAPLGEQQHDGW